MCSDELTSVDYQVNVDDNGVPEELFTDDEPTESAIHDSLAALNVPVCTAGCVTTTCGQLLVAPGNGVNVAVVTVAIASAYVAANAPGVTASDVCVNVTRIEPTVDQSGCDTFFCVRILITLGKVCHVYPMRSVGGDLISLT